MFLYIDIYIKMYLHLVIITCGLAMLKKSVDQGCAFFFFFYGNSNTIMKHTDPQYLYSKQSTNAENRITFFEITADKLLHFPQSQSTTLCLG